MPKDGIPPPQDSTTFQAARRNADRGKSAEEAPTREGVPATSSKTIANSAADVVKYLRMLESSIQENESGQLGRQSYHSLVAEEVRAAKRRLANDAVTSKDVLEQASGVGRTTVSKDYAVGDSSIWVTSAMELFGPLVELVKSDTDGRFTLQFISNAAPRTVQLGEHSPCVNVEKVVNNQLFVTPISVRGSGYENDPVVFGSCGPSGLTGLADRINKPGLAAQDARRVDMTAVRAEIEALESIGIDTAAGSKHETAKKIEAAKGKPGGGFKTEKQIEAEETEERADACFWDGLMNEKMDDPVKIFYCPFIDSRAECGLNARLAYTEAARLFGRCIDLENTHLTYYAKRCMSLCKLRMFARALPDAENYAKMRPDSPTGHCLKGVVYDGLNMYNQSIATLQHALDCAEIIPYDGSRVWSLGTLVADNLEKAVERRAQVADRARVSNQHGVKWRTLGQYDRAIPCLIEAAQLQKQCVGDAHLHYATCLNNLGACLEAMGNYDDALQQYKNSLLVCEIASPGTLRSAIFSARHLPYIMKGGALQEGEWVEGGESSDTYVEVEIVGGANTSRGDHAVCTKVVADSLQPTWNQVLSLKLPRGDCSVIVRLVCRNPQRHALQEAATEKRQMIGEPRHQLQELKNLLDELSARMQRLKEIGRAKEKELEKVTRQYKKELRGVQPLDERIKELQEEAAQLSSRCEGMEDSVIGQFEYPIIKLSSQLGGQSSCSIREWIETPDIEGKRVRGEDYGVTALQVEMTWIPYCNEYATRLCNIGNLHRILGDKLRGGDKKKGGVCEEYKKLEVHYNLAESHLEASLQAMERAKSIAPPQQMTVLQAERAKQRGELQDGDRSESQTVDGTQTQEYCEVLENLALLQYSRGLSIVFPKGTPESVRTNFDGTRSKSQKRAVEMLERAMQLRSDLLGAETQEFLHLLRILAQVYIELGNAELHKNATSQQEKKVNAKQAQVHYRDALPVQERALHLAKKLFGDKSNETALEIERLAQLHLRLGDTHVVEMDHGSWKIDSKESWHWDMVSKMRQKVTKASSSTHDFASREAAMLRQTQDQILSEKKRIEDPPAITDYAEPKEEDPLLKKAKAETERRSKTRGELGDIKVSRALASKQRAPQTSLVRMDIQRWPKSAEHTKSS